MPNTLKTCLVALAATLISAVALADARSIPYTAEAFAEAQEAGNFIVVDVYADWCPTCRAQKPTLDELKGEPALADALFVVVDFDTDKEFLREHRIARQSTILLFDGAQEIDRSVAETDRERLRAFVLDAATASMPAE